MNVLVHRPLDPALFSRLQTEFPDIDIRQEPSREGLQRNLGWAEIIFGNPPAGLVQPHVNIKWLQIVSSGIDEYLPLAHSPTVVTTAHGVHAQSIAQQVIMSMLAFARGDLHFRRCQERAIWDRNPGIPFSLQGHRVGFVGCGAIARETMKFAPLLGFTSQTFRRAASHLPDLSSGAKEFSDLDELLQTSEHIILSLPLTSETKNLIDARRVGLLKPGAFFYNMARGGLVEEDSLRQRLVDGTLGGAALDVFQNEPLLPDDPWWKTPRTILTPHIAGHHRALGENTLAIFMQNLRLYIKGEPLLNRADFRRGY